MLSFHQILTKEGIRMRKRNRGTQLRRSTYIMVRLSPEEKEIWKRLALEEKTDFSELVRELVRERAKARGVWN